MHDILWNLGAFWRKRLSPHLVGILTHPGCVVCWAINMYLKKKHPFWCNQSFSTCYYPGGLPYQIPKSWLFQKPCTICSCCFFDFFEKKKNCVQKETSQQNPPTDFTTRSRSSVSRIRRVPISGVGHRMFGGRWKPPREVPRESRGRKSLLVRGIPFFWLGMWSLELCLEAIFFKCQEKILGCHGTIRGWIVLKPEKTCADLKTGASMRMFERGEYRVE